MGWAWLALSLLAMFVADDSVQATGFLVCSVVCFARADVLKAIRERDNGGRARRAA